MASHDEWLAQVTEPAIEPNLPICDPHHHFWDRRDGQVARRYLMDEIQRDLQSGHNIISTVFIEHLSMYRADGPREMQYVGGITGIGSYAGRREEIFQAWRKSIADLAQCPNVVVKLGGLSMDYCGFGWHERPLPPSSEELAAATRGYFETVIELFGPERCMFESNFPVDKISCSYGVLWNSFKRITEGYSASDKAKLYHDTAVRVYRLACLGNRLES